MADVGKLVAFLDGIPDGDRHKAFFWAANVAVEDGLSPTQFAKLKQAAIACGLDEAYVNRTAEQVRKSHEERA